MRITKIRINCRDRETKLMGYASITLDNIVAINCIKILQSRGEFFLGMPSQRRKNGGFQDVAHPIVPEARAAFVELIVGAYTLCDNNGYYAAEFELRKENEKELFAQKINDFQLTNYRSSQNDSNPSDKINTTTYRTTESDDFIKWLNG